LENILIKSSNQSDGIVLKGGKKALLLAVLVEP